MTNTDNIDKFGHCVLCHRYLITKRVVDGKIIEMFTPDHDHTDFLLDNGSMMKVCMCKGCKSTSDLNDTKVHEQIMDAVNKGWELETKMLVADTTIPDWTQEHADKYISDMAQLNISIYADNVDKNVLVERSKELGESFREVIKLNKESAEVSIVADLN